MSTDGCLVVTKSYPENLSGGIMVCGINLGMSPKDREVIASGIPPEEIEQPSFFFDSSVRETDEFRKRIIKWLGSWGLEFTTVKGKETGFEKSFFQTNWINSQTSNADEINDLPNFTKNAKGILTLIEQRKPSVILFFGVNLIEAFNSTWPMESLGGKSVRDEAISILGERSGNPVTHSVPGVKLRFQKFGNTQIISLPHPATWGLSDEDIKSLRPPLEVLNSLLKK